GPRTLRRRDGRPGALRTATRRRCGARRGRRRAVPRQGAAPSRAGCGSPRGPPKSPRAPEAACSRTARAAGGRAHSRVGGRRRLGRIRQAATPMRGSSSRPVLLPPPPELAGGGGGFWFDGGGVAAATAIVNVCSAVAPAASATLNATSWSPTSDAAG